MEFSTYGIKNLKACGGGGMKKGGGGPRKCWRIK
jgi:hypothetical protein